MKRKISNSAKNQRTREGCAHSKRSLRNGIDSDKHKKPDVTNKESPRTARLKRRIDATLERKVKSKKPKKASICDKQTKNKTKKNVLTEKENGMSSNEDSDGEVSFSTPKKKSDESQDVKRKIQMSHSTESTRRSLRHRAETDNELKNAKETVKEENDKPGTSQQRKNNHSGKLSSGNTRGIKKQITDVETDSEPEEISSDDLQSTEEISDSEEDSLEIEKSITEISDDGEDINDDEEVSLYHAGLVNQASLQMKVKKLESMLEKVHSQFEMKVKKKDEEVQRLKNEIKWKDEQLEERNEVMTKNMEMEAKINFMLSDRKCYEKEIERVKKEEENKKRKEELIKKEKEEKAKKEEEEGLAKVKEQKELDKKAVKKDGKEPSKRSKRASRRRKNGDTVDSDGEDIDALFVSDTEDNEIQVVGEKPAEKADPVNNIDLSTSDDEKKEDTEADNQDSQDKDDCEKQGRHNIRKLMGSKKLQEETVKAAKTEKERRERAKKEHEKHLVQTDTDPKTKLPICTKLVLAFKEGTKEPLVEVNQKLIKKLKPHQWAGVQFMWDNVIESMERLKEDMNGQGCILAHCMGLGKTLSVITLVHTLLKNKTVDFKRCLIVCPLNTILNWQYEWKKWLDKKDCIQTYEMASCKHNHDRANLLSEWHSKGGVMIMGYQLFRILANYSGRSKKNKKTYDETLLDPGADIVICDEGHMLKNDASAISKAMNRIRTQRRIVLTGTPLQNNLNEYHCMLTFVKPSLLGTSKEFKNRFVNPISNGQHSDSTLYDVKLMKRRAHILHEMLAGCVQRKDYSALTKLLPQKHEYVVSVRLSDLQIKLYEQYLQLHRPESNNAAGGNVANFHAASLFSDYQALMRIWTHPWVLKLDEIRQEKKKNKKILKESFKLLQLECEQKEALLEQDDELDTSDEEEIIISSDTEEDDTTTTVSSDEDQSSEENSDESDDTRKNERKTRGKRKKQDTKVKNKEPAKAKTIEQDQSTKKVSDKDSDSNNEQESKTTRSSRHTTKKDIKHKTVKEPGKKTEKILKLNDSTKANGHKERKTEESDVEVLEESSSTESATSNVPVRKAKVLAGEVIRKWGSTSRHGGTEPLNLEDLIRKENPWWYSLVNEEEHKTKLELSGKLVLFFEILRMAETLGDKLLVFSQSLLTLDIMETFLCYKNEEAEKEAANTKNKRGQKQSFWKKDEDYLRMDGSTGAQNRSKFVNNFNDMKNKRLRLFLISTKAGGLGVNLEGANRVIIFDASWNPSHDIQSIFRVYRFGQVKPVYVYRFLAQGTMEEKIYERQVTKETLSQRVIDEHQVDRHFTAADLQELYIFQPDRLNDPNCPKRPTPAVPKDIILADLMTTHKDWIVHYHEHDSLLENRPEEDLSEEERAAAWEEYEREKKGLYMYSEPPPSQKTMQPTFLNTMYRPPRIQFFGASSTPMQTAGVPTFGPIRPVAPPPDQTRANFQISQLPRVVQEILKYNPSIGPEELQRRLQAFLGMQNRFTSIPGHALGRGRPPGFPVPQTENKQEQDLPSRLPQPGILPATNKISTGQHMTTDNQH